MATRKQLGYRPSLEVHEALKRLAEKENRSLNQMIDYVIKKYIEAEAKQNTA